VFCSPFVMLVHRLQQFVDMAVTQLGLEFQLAHSMATRSSFRGRRKCPQRRQMKQQNRRHIQSSCHNWTFTQRCWRKFSVDTVWHARTSWRCCRRQTVAALDQLIIHSSSWSAENERTMTIASFRRIMNVVNYRLVPSFFCCFSDTDLCGFYSSAFFQLCAFSAVTLLVSCQDGAELFSL